MDTKKKDLFKGHLIAVLTVAVWGTTYISTKILLRAFSPAEILITRFVLGYLFLWLLHPKTEKVTDKKHELLFFGAGLSGMTLYYLLENVSLLYTTASNVGVIIAAAPFLTALLAKLFFRKEKPLGAGFYVGMVLAFAGIALMSFNSTKLQLNPKGDLLALAGALAWAVYSVIIKKLDGTDYNVIFVTRRIFFWGIVTIIPIVLRSGFHPDLAQLKSFTNLFNLLYLGIIASAVCFVTWNYALKVVGAVKTSVYIYLTPIVTIVTSIIVLGERLTPISAFGTALTLTGLLVSENPVKLIKAQDNS